MKQLKIWSIILLATMMMPLAASAQSVYDEDDLIGDWINESDFKEPPFNIKRITILDGMDKDYGSYYGKIEAVYGRYYLCDYFITSSNRLHLYFVEGGGYYRFLIGRINTLTSDRLSFSYIYNENGIKTEKKLTFKKVNTSSANNIIFEDYIESDRNYNIQGQLIEGEPRNGLYIKGGKKVLAK